MSGVPCKICGTSSPFHGVVDFNKSCESRHRRDAVKGEAVWYNRCGECGFLFTTQFDHWTPEDWRREVYNAGYAAVDPDQANGIRAQNNVGFVADFARQRNLTRILDFGGGDGLLARILTEGFFDAQTWDPLVDQPRPSGDFDLITAFEVFEHSANPRETVAELRSWARPHAVELVSTLTNDDWDVSHWYVSPRNGHVSMHTTRSLEKLFDQSGWTVCHLSAAVHLATRKEAGC